MKKKVTVYTNKSRSLRQSIADTFRYRDLIAQFVKKNITVRYRQTLLGPLWLILMPIIDTVVSAFVFGDIVGVKSGTVPYFLFYYVGVTVWYLFSACVKATGSVFTSNAKMFQKVYYPRLIMPVSDVITTLFTFVIRLFLMLVILFIFVCNGTYVAPVWNLLWLLPLLFLQITLFALGIGLIFSAITAKYRDLSPLLSVFVDLFKYLSPVIYTVISLETPLKTYCMLNPMASVLEAFRLIVLGSGNGEIYSLYLVYSFLVAGVVLWIGLLLFNHTEKTSVDIL